MDIPSGDELLDEWERKQREGVTQVEWAEQLGITRKSLENRIGWARKQRRKREADERDSEFERFDADDHTPGAQFEEDGNKAHASFKAFRIISLDDLIEACKIDLDTWEIVRWKPNAWEGYRRHEEKDLVYEGGRVTGYVKDYGNIVTETLYQVKAELIRKEPLQINPIVQPVGLSVSIPDTPRRPQPFVKRKIVTTDWQVGYRWNRQTGTLDPFHDRAYLDVVLQIMQDNAFDSVAHLGDGGDWTMWTDKFARSPEFYFTTQPMIYELAWWLLQMRLSAPGVKFTYHASNHGNRHDDYLKAHLMEAYDLRPGIGYQIKSPYSLRYLLALDTLAIEYIDDYPNGREWVVDDKLYLEHGSRANGKPGDTVKNVAHDAPSSVIFGHIHRLEQATFTRDTRDGPKTIKAYSPGCGCRLDYKVPGHKRGQNWQQGFAVVEYTDDWYNVTLHEVHDGQAIYNGKVYQAREQVDNLRRDTGWNF